MNGIKWKVSASLALIGTLSITPETYAAEYPAYFWLSEDLEETFSDKETAVLNCMDKCIRGVSHHTNPHVTADYETYVTIHWDLKRYTGEIRTNWSYREVRRLNCSSPAYDFSGVCTTPVKPPELFDRPNGGPDCSTGGPPIAFAGNPVNISTGNKFQQETDLSSSGPQPLILKRSYNSSDSLWRFNYKQRLVSSDTDTTYVVRSDGKTFTYTLANGTWSSDGDVHHRLEASIDGYAWKLTLKSGGIEYYDDQGRVVLLETLQGQQQTLAYVDNTITIDNNIGDLLVITQDPQGLPLTANLNGTETITYGYDDWDRLVSVTHSDSTSRQYHYENADYPYGLTGITDERGVRFGTWDYDDQGRANSSEHAGQERTDLVFNADGSTTVTNPLGKQTTYHFAEIEGLKRVTQVEGHASANCLAANKDYSYYANGLLETRTDWQGVTTRFEYNDRGLKTRRIEAEGTPQERITTWTWDPTKPLNLTRTEGGKTTTYQYNHLNQLIRKQDSAAQ